MDISKMKRTIEKELLQKEPYPGPRVADMPHLGSAMDLYHALADQDVADLELYVKAISLKRQYMSCDWTRTRMDEKKAALGMLFKNANKTIKENKASISRFGEIIREKAVDKGELGDQIFMTKIELQQYKDTAVEMEKYVTQYNIFERFLEEVARDAVEFNSVGDVLNRYESLEATRKECLRTLEEELGEAAALRRQMAEVVEERSAKLKNLANSLITLQVRSKHAEETRRNWERVVGRLRGVIMGNEGQSLELAGGCWDLYHQMCCRRRVPLDSRASPRDIVAQLDYIQNTIMFYKEVNTIAVAAKQAQGRAPTPPTVKRGSTSVASS